MQPYFLKKQQSVALSWFSAESRLRNCTNNIWIMLIQCLLSGTVR